MSISGLQYVANFLSDEQQRWLVDWIDARPWSSALKRRTQHYGWLYSYDRRLLNAGDHLGPLPRALSVLSSRIGERITLPTFDQAIINEYTRGQRISAHIDHVKNFGSHVATVSLGAPATMRFTRGGITEDVELAPGSLAVLSGDARYRWTHELLPVDARRISITFRSAIVP